MFDTRYVIPKLTYEILNVSIAEIADIMGLTTGMVQDIADAQNWTRWFTDDIDSASDFNSSTSILKHEEELLEGEDLFTVRADQFLDKNRKRLQVFNMAKEIALAEHYAEFEVSIISKAREAIDDLEVKNVSDLKNLSSIYKDLAKSLQGVNNAVSFTQDEGGLPTVIIRDLSGK